MSTPPSRPVTMTPDASVPLAVGLMVLGLTVFLALTGTTGLLSVVGLGAAAVAGVVFFATIAGGAGEAPRSGRGA